MITGALESMEDAHMFGVEPVGAFTEDGRFPEMFKSIIGSSPTVGNKKQPNVEAILNLKPDVIIDSSKSQSDVMDKLTKITPANPVSNLATDWKANLRLMGELTGKEAEAEQIVKLDKKDLATAKKHLQPRRGCGCSVRTYGVNIRQSP
ncbi:ABC transporter substrate-binding protein [Bacillus swezeyi]|uniref:Fe/B12 periplasmic-binding domain-containing protein n=2 Tax=Bacillus swezeyi TaxID=1925020 RepID=A0A5M8RR47_9BACI|nr:hypothetical protein DX927_15635 [Bacillus swezeyi]TYS33361.1 ABC transporter substrate-binding protein [Bacillus swezeyi]